MVKVPRERYPLWVKLGLLGLHGRAAAWAFVWFSLLTTAITCGLLASAGDPRWYVGLLFLFAALMYWLTIRWVDRHGSWESDQASTGTPDPAARDESR